MKGFTLIELLAVIVILGIITLIITISTTSIINNSKNGLTEIQIKNIENVAQTYYIKEGINNDDTTSDIDSCVNVSYLIEHGYFDGVEILNPKDKKKMRGSVKITSLNGKYKYEYQTIICPN